MHAREIDGREILERHPARTDLAPARAGEVGTECLEQAGTAVGARAPADPDDDVPVAGIEREPDELAGPA